ncbi:hypothetical protein OS493_025213 [Desmophyllum pertusum]|uniref:Uncharacterized protein n=1 Tax=Desmophyllum pertusum TaxID=174260 RepID=A0A9W9ZQ06_9CNID|nr:hypothetical protein OS493_025213 [Desmophyllum pertusum]
MTMLQAMVTKEVAGILLIQVSFALAEFSLQRSSSIRIGKFDTHIKDTVLAGYVISKSQAPSRMDCAFDCLSDQRCGSYNYEEGDKVLHVCELNSECKESKPSNLTGKAGYSYYGTGRNVPSGCLSSPCMNNGTCEDSCMEGTGYKCVCIDGRMGDKCQNWTSTAQDYEVLFSNESTTDYIESEINEVLQQFTLCFWMKRIPSGWTTFFSHMTPEGERNLRLRCSKEMDKCHLTLIKGSRSLDMVPVNDNLWHHICVSWENVEGRWDVLVDGALRAHGSAWRQTLSLSPGKVVVGQSQETYGGGFILKESFTGKIGSFNIWSTKMANNEIREKAKLCSQELGNVIDWRMFRHGIHGNPELLSPQSCVSHVAASEYIFHFPARNVSSYVETATLPTLKKFTLSFWMKQGYNGLLTTGIISYATAQMAKSLTLTLGSIGAIHLRIMDSR